MNKHDFLKKVWKIADKNNVEIETETIAINMTSNYTKEFAYACLSVSSKLNQDNFIPSKKQLELHLINLNCYKKHYFLNELLKYMKILNINKKIGPTFVQLIRYLTWYDIKTDFKTIILAIQILKKYNQYKVDFFIKYHRLYQLFVSISKMYDVTIESLIIEYYKIKT